MDEQEEKNQEESSIKQAARKGKDKLKDEGKKQAKKKLIQLIAKNPKVLAVIAIVILVVIVLIILFAGFLYVLNIITSKETSDAKNTAVAISYDGQTGTKENTRIIIKPTNNGTYEISNNFTNEELEEVKRKVRGESNIDTSEFSDFELAVLGALLQNGLDLDSYDDDELHCLPYFLKAESSTQFLDLRKNSEKFDSQGNYVPELLDDLEEEEVPGIILVQRTNTTDNNPTTLEYIQKAEFDKMVNNNDIDVINYFTMTDKGNLLIAKWDHIDVEVEGEYPDNVSEEEKEAERDEDIISTEEINYSQYVKKYTMPFDFLVQLLVITEEPEFCKEIANVVLGSKIVINIQEEETVTVTTEVKDYTVHNKDEKRINYYISPEIEIESNDNYLLNYTTDDEGNDCTNYNTEDFQVTVTTTYTSHSYVFEISEADTWLAHYVKTYQNQDAVSEPETNQQSEIKGNYSDNEPTVTTIEDSSATIQDEDVKEFKDSKEKYYRDRITIPEVEVSTSSNNSIPTKTITITPQSMVKSVAGLNSYTYTGTTDASGNVIYNLPGSIAVTTNATNEIPSIDYIYTLYNDDEYRTTADKNGLTECVVEKLETKTFQKTDVINNVTINVTKYPSDPNPTTRTHIYATKSGKPGRGYGDENTEYEKFLAAYNNNRNAIEQINSVDSWLYEMMEENENTVNMVDTVKYLLYMYDGINRGVTELEDFETIFNPDEFISATSGGIVVKVDESGSPEALTKEQITEIINKRFSGKQKSNLLGVIDDLMYIQNTYKVNAVFAIAVFQKESSCGTNWAAIDESTYNWASVSGGSGWKKYSSFNEATRDFGNLIANNGPYFKSGNYTISAIGNKYCVPPEGWINGVSQFVTEMYEIVGITIYSSEGNELQQKVVEVATNSSKYGVAAVKDRCQAWVADVYEKAGANNPRASADTAILAGRKWGVSTDWNQIQVGATVYGYASQSAGHVGIYIGNGIVAHNVGGVAYDDLETWIQKYNGVCWGWNGGTDLTGTGQYTCKYGLI